MRGLKYPWQRDELLVHLRDLADSELQRREWMPGEGRFDYVVHFLFDDHDPRNALGYFLRTPGEVEAVVAVVDAIDVVFGLYGTGLEDQEYVAKPEWRRVIEAARAACAVLGALSPESESGTCCSCEQAADASCVRCGRPLCSMHRRERSGISLNVFGPFFDDGKVRCGDCYAARFWRAAVALTVIIGGVVALWSLARGAWTGVAAGAVLGLVGAAFSLWRATSFDRRAGIGHG